MKDDSDKEDLRTDDLCARILDEFGLKNKDGRLVSPLVLAYLGDAVYEAIIRTLLVCGEDLPVHELHKRSVGFVRAKAQSDIVHRINGLLFPEEQEIIRRGRNAKSGTIPKSAEVVEYKHATGFEALIGYLYLKGDTRRLLQVMKLAIPEEYIRGDKGEGNK